MNNFFKKLFKIPNLKSKLKIIPLSDSDIPKDFNIKFEFGVKIEGLDYAKPDINKISLGKKLELILEPNKYDDKAIKVTQNNITLGYISRNSTLQGLIYRFYSTCLIVATLEEATSKNIIIDIKLYDSNKTKYISTEYTLIKIKKSYSNNWDFVKYNEILNIKYDNDKYIVVNRFNEPLGILSKNITKNFDTYKDVFCHTDYINYKYDDIGDKVVTYANLIIMHVECR